MLFTSGEFLFVYLPLTLLLFFLIARYVGNAAAAAWLVLASFVFYAYWLPLYTGLLAASVCSTTRSETGFWRAPRIDAGYAWDCCASQSGLICSCSGTSSTRISFWAP